MKKLQKIMSLALFAMLALNAVAILRAYSAGATTIYVDPADSSYDASTTSVGTLFNVTVKVSNVVDMKTWQVKMWFNNSIINVTRWYEPKTDPAYVFYGQTTLPVPAPPKPAYGPGWLGVGASLFPAPSVGGGFTGNGLLCILTFNITAIPPPGETYSCALNITNYPDTFWIVAGQSAKTSFDQYQNGNYEIQGPAGPHPPAADFTWTPESPQAGRTVTFDASSSSPNGGEIVRYEWDFGDGNTGTGEIVTHVYSTEGTYDVTLNVTDNEELWNSILKTVTVQLKPPYRSTDIIANGKVDMQDISVAVDAFLTEPDHPRWDERCDIDYSNSVDMMDIALIMADFRP